MCRLIDGTAHDVLRPVWTAERLHRRRPSVPRVGAGGAAAMPVEEADEVGAEVKGYG